MFAPLSPQGRHAQPGLQPQSPVLVNMLPTGMQPMVQPLHGSHSTPGKSSLFSPKAVPPSPLSAYLFSATPGAQLACFPTMFQPLSPSPGGIDWQAIAMGGSRPPSACGHHMSTMAPSQMQHQPSDQGPAQPQHEPSCPDQGNAMDPMAFQRQVMELQRRAQYLLIEEKAELQRGVNLSIITTHTANVVSPQRPTRPLPRPSYSRIDSQPLHHPQPQLHPPMLHPSNMSSHQSQYHHASSYHSQHEQDVQPQGVLMQSSLVNIHNGHARYAQHQVAMECSTASGVVGVAADQSNEGIKQVLLNDELLMSMNMRSMSGMPSDAAASAALQHWHQGSYNG